MKMPPSRMSTTITAPMTAMRWSRWVWALNQVASASMSASRFHLNTALVGTAAGGAGGQVRLPAAGAQLLTDVIEGFRAGRSDLQFEHALTVTERLHGRAAGTVAGLGDRRQHGEQTGTVGAALQGRHARLHAAPRVG